MKEWGIRPAEWRLMSAYDRAWVLAHETIEGIRQGMLTEAMRPGDKKPARNPMFEAMQARLKGW